MRPCHRRHSLLRRVARAILRRSIRVGRTIASGCSPTSGPNRRNVSRAFLPRSIAAAVDLRVEKADARAWLRDALAADAPQDGVCTVLFHSVFIQYLEPASRAALVADILAKGDAATAQKPFAWLRMEGSEADKQRCELRLTLWPGGEDRALADVDWHGRSAHWH